MRTLRTERPAPGRAVTDGIPFAGYCGPVNGPLGAVARYTAAARLEMSSLRVDILKVLGDRLGADLQRVRYGTVREAQGDEFEDLKFAAGQVASLAAS
jgi:hypothetical protein